MLLGKPKSKAIAKAQLGFAILWFVLGALFAYFILIDHEVVYSYPFGLAMLLGGFYVGRWLSWHHAKAT